MIGSDFLYTLIDHLRSIGTDNQNCEVKEAVQKLPQSLPQTVSAFANGKGGLIILGLSEQNHFAPAKNFDAQKIHDAMLQLGDRLTPTIRMEVEILPFEGQKIVVANVPPLSEFDKPCYVTTQGRYAGSYIRTGDGDRLLTSYEVDRLIEVRRQPTYDCEPVLEASVTDLNPKTMQTILQRQRESHPRVFGQMQDHDMLLRLGILKEVEGNLHPTLAALLAFGNYPQQFFPRLCVTFTQYAGKDKAQRMNGERYLFSKTLIGPISDMLYDTVKLVQDRTNTRAIIDIYRQDIPDYPTLAIREALSNALQHRDYSAIACGSPIEVNLFSDRLEISSPGGFYGIGSVQDLMTGNLGITNSRNQRLSMLLETTPFGDGYVVENRGTGLYTIRETLKYYQLPAVKIKSTLSTFVITFTANRRDISSVEMPTTVPNTLTDFLTNTAASVQADPAELLFKTKKAAKVAREILSQLARQEPISATELAQALELSRNSIFAYLKTLVAANLIEPTKPARSPDQRYRLKKSR